MTILREPSAWSKDNAAILQQFFGSGTGQLFLAHVAVARPSLVVNGVDPNQVALRASEAAGWEGAINYALSLSEPPKIERPDLETYPPLDDDSKWTDKTP